MAQSEDTTDQPGEVYSPSWWLRQIARYEKTFDKWEQQGNKLLKLYAKQKSDHDTEERRFAMLYANTEVLKPSVYSRPPVPDVSRRFKDRDPVGRLAADFLERGATYELQRQNIDQKFRSVRDDLLLPGRGTLWGRYEAEIDGEDAITDERVQWDYVNWRDFGHLPARIWDEVDAIWRRVFYSRQEAKEKEKAGVFDKGIANKLSYVHKDINDGQKDQESAESKAVCYEIWCKKDKKQYLVSKDLTDFLKKPGAPPLDFENFWPCPKPVYSLLTTDNLIPTPDYKHYQDQAQEIDDLTGRIAKLTDALKAVGFYPLGAGDTSTAIERALDPSVENKLIGIESWATFSEHGGGKAIEWLPIEAIANTITQCVALRTQLIQDVYQISGISDILRGSTDPNETASAQQLKAQWGSVRIKDRQQGMADFCRDIVRLTCEVIAERFEPERVMRMANMEIGDPPAPQPAPPQQPQMGQQQMQPGMGGQQAPPPPDPAMMAYQKKVQDYQKAFELLKDEKLRGFRIDIETDSTIQPDEDAQKQRVNELLTAVGGFMQEAMPLIQMAPEFSPMMGELLLFVVRSYGAGRQLEEAVEQSIEAMGAKIEQAKQNPPPDPAQQKVQQEGQIAQQKLQIEKAKADNVVQLEQRKLQNQTQIEQMKAAAQMQNERAKMQMQAESQMFQARNEAQMGQQQMQNEMQMGNAQMQQDGQMQERQMSQDAQMQAQQESKEDKAVMQQLAELRQLIMQIAQQLTPQNGMQNG